MTKVWVIYMITGCHATRQPEKETTRYVENKGNFSDTPVWDTEKAKPIIN